MTDFLGPVRSRVFYGFVAAGGDPRTAVVALRGTVGAAEWWDDLHWDLVPFPQVTDGGKVARGFSDIYSTYGTMTPGQPQAARASATFAADVAHAAASGLGAGLDPALPTVVCGHSLGGALATLLVADLAANRGCRLWSTLMRASQRFARPAGGRRRCAAICCVHEQPIQAGHRWA